MPSLPGQHFLRNLVTRRNLIYELVRRDFRQRFVGSAGGWLWSVIHPIVLLASWTFVFQVCLKSPSLEGEVTQNYTLYLFCGFLPWLLFQETVQRSASALVEHANLITKTLFPSEIIPVSVFLSSLISHSLALLLAVISIAVWEHRVSPLLLLLPVYTLLTGLLAVGLGWIVASLQVYIRDTAQVLSVALTFWFWTTPIFISEKQIPASLRWVVQLNPLAYVVRAYRESLLSDRLPALPELAILTAYAVTAFLIGGLFFRHLKRGFADVL